VSVEEDELMAKDEVPKVAGRRRGTKRAVDRAQAVTILPMMIKQSSTGRLSESTSSVYSM
jgi:hypothetical protein